MGLANGMTEARSGELTFLDRLGARPAKKYAVLQCGLESRRQKRVEKCARERTRAVPEDVFG